LSALPRYYATASSSFVDEFRQACRDLILSVRDTRIWLTLGLNDIVARYRGSILGPFWITLTTAIFVLGIGFLYADLMKVSVDRYLPWMTTGLVVWGLISQTVLDGADAFISVGHVMRQTALPAPIFVWRVVWRNLLNFAHQLPVLVVMAIKFNYVTTINLPEAVLGAALILLNVSWFALVCGALCARYRDLKQILASLTQLLFFLSPVMWIPGDMKGVSSKLIILNPVAHMLNVLRGPLLGQGISRASVILLVIIAAIGWSLTMLFYAKVRRRLVHYV
jgi:lipopolysaccharide transport system permease protein